jgi:predicted CXXCH cytochrome family protein
MRGLPVSAPPGQALLRRGLAALLILLGALALACTPESRHEILSFVFDGVPEPGTVEARPPTAAELTTGQEPPWRDPFEPPQFFASVHQPYRERDCWSCHAPRPFIAALPPDQSMCLPCHGERLVEENWAHGPLRLALCSVCHEPHLSEHVHLERTSQPGLCTVCHGEPDLMSAVPEHVGQEARRCTDCHDPHREGAPVVNEAGG